MNHGGPPITQYSEYPSNGLSIPNNIILSSSVIKSTGPRKTYHAMKGRPRRLTRSVMNTTAPFRDSEAEMKKNNAIKYDWLRSKSHSANTRVKNVLDMSA